MSAKLADAIRRPGLPERSIYPDGLNTQTVEQVERELRDTFDQLQSTHAEFETTIEELPVASRS